MTKIGKLTKERKAELKALRKAIKKGQYDWSKAIENAANKIEENPEALLWR